MEIPTSLTNALRLGAPERKLPIVLEIDLSLGLQSELPQDPLTALRSRMTPRLPHVIAGLRHGAQDDDVVAAIVHISPTVGVAQAEELGLALRDFSAAGKKVIAWSESFGELGPGTVPYYLATAADAIWLQPSGGVGLQGVGLDVTTVRGVLDKISAQPQFGQRHEYKSAAELYTATEISEPNREMTGRIGDSITEQVISATARARSIAEDRVREAISNSPLTAEQAVEYGLVDRLGYRADVFQALREEFGRDGDHDQSDGDHGQGSADDHDRNDHAGNDHDRNDQAGDRDDHDRIRLQFAHRYARSITKQAMSRARERRRPIIAVVDVTGAIVTGRGSNQLPGRQQAGSDTVIASLRAAADNDAVRAVVLRVDSPGGSYVASDAIRDAVLRVKQSGRPVIASMGALAASGGYFVSMPADRIVALPSTLTGSIGVLGGKIVIKETLARIGITRESIGNRPATMFSANRLFDDEEWQKVDAWLDAVYDDFTHKAASDRGLEYEALESNARGRVWTGADARERGLVDELGGLRRAVELACQQVGVDHDHVRVQQFPQLPMLARLRPAESSESPAAVRLSSRPAGMLELVASALGVQQAGVLTLPWHFEIS